MAPPSFFGGVIMYTRIFENRGFYYLAIHDTHWLRYLAKCPNGVIH